MCIENDQVLPLRFIDDKKENTSISCTYKIYTTTTLATLCESRTCISWDRKLLEKEQEIFLQPASIIRKVNKKNNV